ncbi:uncharacterized protein Z518_08034 [Rhinocladiella mackenziei CBS 650.93]|uniref:Uncharacterized protein n=1 Tax=Rhinocladiella mackenziei CBS 650.93 TaxID=1442369 RepID=A0A0D2IZR1_9EURO|nr:uncharacterized protein Z518_08034 [Rhinocladiella mackenziei CBS 650.93]KIX02095.1 hypothetical protein Z518_08034 [Rhinocladiella mackenziei CBS 650.93]
MEGESGTTQPGESGFNGISRRDQLRSPTPGTSSPSRGGKAPSEQHMLDSFQQASTRQSTPNSHLRTPASEIVPIGGRVFHPDASLVLVGIRASGKRSLGFIAATALGRRFITEDHYFQTVNGLSRQDYLKIHGSEQFHKQDIETSKQMLEDNKYRCVIDCGLGSLTRSLQDYLRQYSQTNPVVFILRDMDQITKLLNLDDRSAKLLESGNSTHRKCSNFEFYNLEDESMNVPLDAETTDRGSPNYSFKLRYAQADFSSFVRFITGTPATQSFSESPFSLDGPVELRTFTHTLLLKLSDFVDGLIDFAALESASDVLEIFVDQWHSLAARSLSKMVSVARRSLGVPILLSASRQLSESSIVEAYLNVLTQGLRLGIQYLSVDLDIGDNHFSRLRAIKGHTKLIGNYVNYTPNTNGWKDPKWKDMYNKAVNVRCDMVRLRNVPTSRQENESLSWFVQELKDLPGPRLVSITYNVGPLGRSSQIMNTVLTSVTHPIMSATMKSPQDILQPQLSSRDIVKALFDSFVFDPLHFYIVGANVSGSLSPAMHNAAYAFLGLQHRYSTRNINSWTDIEELAKEDTLGGLSIVQPYKVKIVPRVESLSGHAKAIGAVNTLVPLRANAAGAVPPLQIQAQERNRAGRIVGWFGENTDFIGIMTCLNRSLSPRNVIQPRTTGLVIGAGGMARAAVYAMLQMGCKNIFVHNRTIANTIAMVRHFNDWAKPQANGHATYSSAEPVKVIEFTTDPWPESFALPTMVVSCVTHEFLDGNPGANFEMPDSWMQSPSGGVVVEMAYMTKETPLVTQMKRFRETTGRPWVIVEGIETLIEQAVAQFESMTGRKAPKRCMADAVHNALEKNTSYLVDGEEFYT